MEFYLIYLLIEAYTFMAKALIVSEPFHASLVIEACLITLQQQYVALG